MFRTLAACATLLLLSAAAFGEDKVLFDFEDETDLKAWSQVNYQDLVQAAQRALLESLPQKPAKLPALTPTPEAPLKMEWSAEHASSGKHSLKLTYSGGKFPTVGTDKLPVDDWKPFKAFRADVTAGRTCVVVFRVLYEKSTRGDDWDSSVGRYEKVARLDAGANEVVELTYARDFANQGKVVRFEISMYAPHEGESITVDNIRLSTELSAATTPYSYMNVHFMGEVRDVAPYFPKLDRKIKVLGTDWEFTKLPELGEKLKDAWKMPEKKSVEQIEDEFRAKYEALKKAHPKAVLARFREGDTGFDAANPDRAYKGWQNAYMGGHDPGAVYAKYLGTNALSPYGIEMFLRRRCPLLRVDLSSISQGSTILAARFWGVKTESPRVEALKGDYAWASPLKPAFFAAEPCNRDWDENFCNGIEYGKGKFWKEICGMYWSGDSPDFLPLVIAYGQAGHDVNDFDFTEAVRWWTEGTHPNYGFVISSFVGYMEFCTIWTKDAAVVGNRPAMMVIYEPKP